MNNVSTTTPETYRNFAPKTFAQPPSLADLDLDGDLEIALPTEQGDVFVVYEDGSDYPGWPYSDPDGQPTTAVALANIVGSGSPDLAFAQENAKVHLFYEYGIEVGGWPHTTVPGWWLYGGPIMDTIDADSPDVVIGSRDGFGYAWDNLNTGLEGWPKDLRGQTEVSPACGDVDNDGHLELVFVTRTHLAVIDVGPLESSLVGEQYRWPMFMHDPQRTSCAD